MQINYDATKDNLANILISYILDSLEVEYTGDDIIHKNLSFNIEIEYNAPQELKKNLETLMTFLGIKVKFFAKEGSLITVKRINNRQQQPKKNGNDKSNMVVLQNYIQKNNENELRRTLLKGIYDKTVF